MSRSRCITAIGFVAVAFAVQALVASGLALFSKLTVVRGPPPELLGGIPTIPTLMGELQRSRVGGVWSSLETPEQMEAERTVFGMWPWLSREPGASYRAWHWRGFGLRYTDASASAPGRETSERQRYEAGWPMRSMVATADGIDGTLRFGAVFPDTWVRDDRQDWLYLGSSPAEGVIPLRPMLWPTLVNTACYAGVLFLFPLALRARRAMRRSKDACPGCGYDRSGLAAEAVCPECGATA